MLNRSLRVDIFADRLAEKVKLLLHWEVHSEFFYHGIARGMNKELG
jgi:hypothetical protein